MDIDFSSGLPRSNEDNLAKTDNEVKLLVKDDVKLEVEFWPVEHPVEPEDEDRPVKCPMPVSSIINHGKTNEERLMEQKDRREVTPPPRLIRAVRKRHHTLTRDNNHTTKPIPSRNNITIYQVLQESDDFKT